MALNKLVLLFSLTCPFVVIGVAQECTQDLDDGQCVAGVADTSALLQNRINVDNYFQVDADLEDEENEDDEADSESEDEAGGEFEDQDDEVEEDEEEDELDDEGDNMIDYIYAEHDDNNAEPILDMLEDDMDEDMDASFGEMVDFSVSKEDLVPPTCVAEEAIRVVLKKVVKAANSVRLVFHDMQDFNNLALKNSDGAYEKVDGDYGGVDGCVYSDFKKVKGRRVINPERNRNINNGYVWATDMCKHICRKPWPEGMAGTTMCQSPASCEVDITVFGSLAAIENADGPVMDMSWGREKGNCTRKPIVTPFTKSKSALAAYQSKPVLNEAPSLTDIDDPSSFGRIFANMGFDLTDQVALMGGGHTFGQIQVCAGGLNGVEHGPFCKNAKAVGDLTMGDGSPWKAPQQRWGDGAVWDRTPMTFDNDYFKLFSDESFKNKDDCCGKVKGGGCHRGGRPVTITQRWPAGGAKKWKTMSGGICSVNWCRSDRKGRTHMKSVKAWTMVKGTWPGFAKSLKHGLQKRMLRLAGDWALLSTSEGKAKVKEFAQDQDAFFTAFSSAWKKTIERTHSTLSACTGDKPDETAVNEAVDNLFPESVQRSKNMRGLFPYVWCKLKGRC